MPRKVIQRFEVEYLQILDEDGNVDDSLKPQELDEHKLKEMYHLMVLSRMFGEKLFKLQRSGKIGTCVQSKGQEAAQIGSGFALNKEDWFIPSFREMGVSLVRGADRAKLIEAWKGDTRAFKFDGDCRDLPVAIPIGSQSLHAVGIAWALKLRSEKNAAIVYFGDGATSEGDVHEAMNFAGVLKTPVIFFVQNNQWAISTPRKKQTASETIAQKAIAYGIKGIQVDGNDVMAVYLATKEALERARNGKGATLIEALTYRLSDHTTSDDASKYRSEDEIHKWELKDPITRLRKYFEKNSMWNEKDAKWVEDECTKEIAEAVEKALAIPPPPVEDMFKYIYADMPKDFEEQLADLKEEIAEKGDQK